MKNSKISLVSIILITLLTFTASAQAKTIRGAGAISCGEWAAQRANRDYHFSLAWIFGFVTSFDYYSPLTYGIFDDIHHESVALWLDKYCSENPLDSLPTATDKLIDYLISTSDE